MIRTICLIKDLVSDTAQQSYVVLPLIHLYKQLDLSSESKFFVTLFATWRIYILSQACGLIFVKFSGLQPFDQIFCRMFLVNNGTLRDLIHVVGSYPTLTLVANFAIFKHLFLAFFMHFIFMPNMKNIRANFLREKFCEK